MRISLIALTVVFGLLFGGAHAEPQAKQSLGASVSTNTHGVGG